jgi:glycosyltransferase involved in cell wall biosynthesis
MRVALFVDAPRMGGAERHLIDLATGEARRGHDIHVLAPDSPVVAQMREELDGTATVHALRPRPVEVGSLVRDTPRLVPGALDLNRALRRLRPALLHINNGGFPGSNACRAAAFATRLPTIMTSHAVAEERPPGTERVSSVLDAAVWRRLDRVITGSRAAGDALMARRAMPERLLRVVPYGVPDHADAAGEAAALRAQLAPDGELLVGMVSTPGSHAGWKGHDVLVDALAAAGRTDVRAVVVGHDPGPEYRERAAAAGVADRLTLTGRVPAIPPYMAAFDVLAVPSTRFESLPLVVLEALAAGTPVVASRLSGIPEAVVDGETGWTFEPGDARALAGILDAVAADRAQLERYGRAARARYEARHTIDRMVEGTLAVYGEVADGA